MNFGVPRSTSPFLCPVVSLSSVGPQRRPWRNPALSRVPIAYRALVFVYGMNHLRPEIPTNSVALVDALVQTFDGSINRARSVLRNQVTR